MKPRFIAFYLPQFYPTPENDEWWEPGFTEWTNVARAKPLFKGHYQPRIPQELSFYDLRVPETREKQAKMAREAGIEGFCYWHYWFGNGKRLLADVFRDVVETGKPDFPFCLCWANHSWQKKTWDPNRQKDNVMLMEQTYPGKEDYTAHFMEMLPAFKDKRYMRTEDGRLIFGFYAPNDIPDPDVFMSTWNELARKEGLVGFHFFGYVYTKTSRDATLAKGFDSVCMDYMNMGVEKDTFVKRAYRYIKREFFNIPPKLVEYKDYVDYFLSDYQLEKGIYPCVLPNYDHSPRSQRRGRILNNSTPALWGKLLKGVLRKMQESKAMPDKLVFVKAWNEWGEGNYLEPDSRYGRQYIDVMKDIEE